MLRAIDIASCIEALAPTGIQEPWDHCGFSVGNPFTPVRGVLCCLDCTEAVVQEAVERNLNMIVSHHPLIFKGVRQLCEATGQERTISLAIRNQIVVYSAHTNADKVPQGVTWIMARALGLQSCRVLQPAGELPQGPYGLGVVGKLPQPCTPAAFLTQVKAAFSLAHCKAGARPLPVIETVALCGGSGGSLLEAALESGAQAYVSADLSYHQYFEAEDRMLLVDIGHYESEIGVLGYFINVLQEKFPTFAAYITEKVTNPIRYY